MPDTRPLRIDLYTLTWNDADMLPFFFRHYDDIVDRYIVYDDGSTDETVKLLRAHPRVELRGFGRTTPSSFVNSHRRLQNTCWKASRGHADWVIITAIDEHLHVAGTTLRAYLSSQHTKGVTLAPALGYQMLAETYPSSDEWLCLTRPFGAPFWEMNKLSVFVPDALEATNFAPGRHSAHPEGVLRFPERDELLLLHYKYLDFERTLLRHAALSTGLGEADRSKGYATQYAWTRDRLRQDWDEVAKHAIDTSAPDLHPWTSHPVVRWWRSPAAYATAAIARSIRNRIQTRTARYQ